MKEKVAITQFYSFRQKKSHKENSLVPQKFFPRLTNFKRNKNLADTFQKERNCRPLEDQIMSAGIILKVTDSGVHSIAITSTVVHAPLGTVFIVCRFRLHITCIGTTYTIRVLMSDEPGTYRMDLGSVRSRKSSFP